tara:strand:- start:161 stop:559 length:399 start_codon:yes stop_codon:yes gene_type:complete
MSRPLNINSTNNMISINDNYVKNSKNLENSTYSAIRTNDRPLSNGLTNYNHDDYIGPTRRARPMKHYRRRLNPNNPSVSAKPKLDDVIIPTSHVSRNDNSFLLENNTLFKRHIIIKNNETLKVAKCKEYSLL